MSGSIVNIEVIETCYISGLSLKPAPRGAPFRIISGSEIGDQPLIQSCSGSMIHCNKGYGLGKV